VKQVYYGWIIVILLGIVLIIHFLYLVIGDILIPLIKLIYFLIKYFRGKIEKKKLDLLDKENEDIKEEFGDRLSKSFDFQEFF
jgi:hypothetical protein